MYLTKGALWLTCLSVIFLLAFALRFHLLAAQSFWNDEGNSARLSERAVSLIIEGTASDIHPPLYYLMLHGWQKLAGQTEFGLRAFSAFAGVLLVAVTAAVGKRFSVSGAVAARPLRVRWAVAAVAGLLTAVNPALIYYSQEARMYALLGLLALLSTWCLGNWYSAGVAPYAARSGRDHFMNARRWAVAYVLFAAAGLYTHYFFPAVLVAHNLLVLLWLFPFTIHKPFRFPGTVDISRGGRQRFSRRKCQRLLVSWLAMMLATLLLYAPWLPVFGQQFGVDDLGARGAFLTFVFTAVAWMSFGSTIPLEATTWAVMAIMGLLIMGLLVGQRYALAAFICLVVPLLFMYAAGTGQPEYFKFLLVAAPFLCLLLATAVAGGRKKGPRAVLILLLLVFMPSGTMQSLHNLYYNAAYARADYRALAARILAENHANAGIILNAPNQWEVFTYYYPDETAVYPLPKGRSRPQPEQIETTLREIAAQHDRLYAIFWGEAQRDPERLIERWLDEHAFKATDDWVGDVRFVTYAVPQAAAGAIENAVHLPFGEAITLNGYTLNGVQFRPGDILQVTLFWQTAVLLEERYKVFLHLVAAGGQIVAQRDSEPGGGLNLTTTWPPGAQIIDNHGLLLPAALAPGDYNLLLGLYDPAEPAQRLSVQTVTGAADALSLATIQVRNE